MWCFTEYRKLLGTQPQWDMCLCGQCATDHTSNLVPRFHCTFTGCSLLYLWNLYSLLLGIYSNGPIPAATRSKARVCGRCTAGMAGLNTAGSMTCDYCVLLRGGPCDGPITRPEDPNRVCCVCYFDTSTGRPEPGMAIEAGGGDEPCFTLTALNRLKPNVYDI